MLPMGRASVSRFSDGEVNIELMENVRGRDVFLLQSTCPPVNENLMELLVMGRLPPRLGAQHYRRDPVFRLCAPGPQAARHARSNHGQTGGRYDLWRWR